MKILLAADGSEFTRRAASYLVTPLSALAKAPEIHLINVHAPIPLAGMAGSGAAKKYHEEECKAALAVAEGVFRDAGVQFTSSWTVGDAAEEIVAYAAKNGTDIIVMGSHGHSALRNLALGSVADGILRAAKCPVTIIK
jgi:nucleotide-binding universal stress UspA family protein